MGVPRLTQSLVKRRRDFGVVIFLLTACMPSGCTRRATVCAPPQPEAPPIKLDCDPHAWVNALKRGRVPAGVERVEVDSWGRTVFRVGLGPTATRDEYRILQSLPEFRADVEGWRALSTARCQEEPCLDVSVHVCGADLATIADSLRTRASEKGLRDVQFNLRVEVVGPLKSRCSSNDIDCGPV